MPPFGKNGLDAAVSDWQRKMTAYSALSNTCPSKIIWTAYLPTLSTSSKALLPRCCLPFCRRRMQIKR
ncbi:Uncharacterised protein [Mycobacteroides abscessus subsp. massiliense]|nr:Uncharacterised protein [Mycobacteroides abscessus subsp. massiliense]